MNKKIKNTLVPKLRFPEFREAGEWSVMTLFDLSVDGFSNGVFNDPKKVGTGYKLINVLDMYSETPIDENNLSLVNISKSEFFKNKVEFGDIFFTRSSLVASGIAHSNIYLGTSNDITFDGHLIKLKPNNHIVLPKFLHFLLKTNDIRSQIAAKGKTATMTTIGQADIASVVVSVPTLPEQQKIADTLTALDALISAQQEKINALKRHKKGLMQQLFPAEGERVPRVRFGEFEGEWEERVLGEVAEVITGSTPDTSEINNYGGNRMFVSPADIGDGRYVSRTKTTLTEMGYLQTRHVKENSVLFVCIGSTIGKIAQNKYECATNQQINSVVPYQGYSNEFLYSVLEYNATNIATLAGRQAVPIINKSLFSSVKLKFPPTKLEQQKIAAVLTALDDLLAAEGQRLAALRMWKQGLMQGMFPNANET